jgi:hypothetical protein
VDEAEVERRAGPHPFLDSAVEAAVLEAELSHGISKLASSHKRRMESRLVQEEPEALARLEEQGALEQARVSQLAKVPLEQQEARVDRRS